MLECQNSACVSKTMSIKFQKDSDAMCANSNIPSSPVETWVRNAGFCGEGVWLGSGCYGDKNSMNMTSVLINVLAWDKLSNTKGLVKKLHFPGGFIFLVEF